MNTKQRMTVVLAAASVGSVWLTGCGSDHRTAEHPAETRAAVSDTRRTAARTETTVTAVQDHDDDPFDYDEQPHATSGPDIIDRAESAIDKAEDIVTGLMTDAVGTEHTHD